MTSESNYGKLILTLHLAENEGAIESAEAITLLAHNPDGGEPLPVYIELANGLKACRCGAQLKRARLRVVAPRSVRVGRVPHEEVP